MVAYKDVNGVAVEMTAEEEAELNARKKAWQDGALDRAFKKLRVRRNNLLQECDWTDLPNAVLTDEKKSEWQTYRTNLRDLTNGLTTVEEVENVEFPTNPSESE
jgi:hypothetical protein